MYAFIIGGWSTKYTRWHNYIKPYLGQDWFDPLYRCPSNKWDSREAAVSNQVSLYGGYGYNDRGVTRDFFGIQNFGLGGFIQPDHCQPCRASLVSNPSDTI